MFRKFINCSKCPEKVYLKIVRRRRLQDYFERIIRESGIFPGVFEEFLQHFDRQQNKFFEVVTGASPKVVAAIFVISNGDRTMTTGICMEPSKSEYITIYKLRESEEDKLPATSCTNYPMSILIKDLYKGKASLSIYEYSIDCLDFKHLIFQSPSQYEVKCTIDSKDFESLLQFDYELFSLSNRRHFIESCIERSDVAYIVREKDMVKGFGMLSKKIGNRRLLGPVYATNDVTSNILISSLINFGFSDYSTREIIAYVFEECDGFMKLCHNGFQMKNPGKTWRRLCTSDFNIPTHNIIALGSLLFDEC